MREVATCSSRQPVMYDLHFLLIVVHHGLQLVVITGPRPADRKVAEHLLRVTYDEAEGVRFNLVEIQHVVFPVSGFSPRRAQKHGSESDAGVLHEQDSEEVAIDE
jgi:hypothetical protein